MGAWEIIEGTHKNGERYWAYGPVALPNRSRCVSGYGRFSGVTVMPKHYSILHGSFNPNYIYVVLGDDLIDRVAFGPSFSPYCFEANKHRESYSAADAQAVCDWLNERERGYPRKTP